MIWQKLKEEGGEKKIYRYILKVAFDKDKVKKKTVPPLLIQ